MTYIILYLVIGLSFLVIDIIFIAETDEQKFTYYMLDVFLWPLALVAIIGDWEI